ncbi:MAG: hypothetical protein IKT05_07180 [Fibrobacter sp.]|nr:hypothetical protein [Fibrobacter sp.]
MKKIGYFAAIIALVGVACSKQEVDTPTSVDENNDKVVFELKVTVAPETRATMPAKTLTFAQGDEIAVLGTTSQGTSVIPLAVSDVSGSTVTFSTTVDKDTQIGDYAYYPVSIASSANPTVINWPASFDATKVQVPMMALIDLTNRTAEFKHLGSMLKVNLKDMPAGVNALEFKTTNNFTGSYSVDPATWALTAGTLSGNVETVTVNGNGTYYIPVPAGTYADFQLGMRQGNYYHKQRTAALASPITPVRTNIVNLGDFAYDVDEIEEWYLMSDMNGWTSTDKTMRLIKTGDGQYEISTYVYYINSSNPWYKFYSPNYNVEGVNATSTGTLAANMTCKRDANEVFTSTLTKTSGNWVLSDKGYGSDFDRCYALSDVTVSLDGDVSGNLTKRNHNNNMLWYLEGLNVSDNSSKSFKFHVVGNNWGWWIGGSTVSLSDSKPYAGATAANENMSLVLTPGVYNVYLDIRTLNFMFVKQPYSAN